MLAVRVPEAVCPVLFSASGTWVWVPLDHCVKDMAVLEI